MGSSTKKKKWPWILAAPVVLVLAAMLALKLWFTDERLKALIVPEIESATHRSVGIGDISFSFFPGIGISVSEFTLSNPPGSAFPNPYLLSVRGLFIDVSLLPLLSRRLEVNTLRLEQPVVYLDVTAEGRRNTSTGGGARIAGDAVDPGATGGEEVPAAGAFLLSNLEITDGRVESYNRKLDSRWIVDGLRQTVRLRADGTGKTATVEGESDIRGFSYGSGSSWYVENLPVSATERFSYDAAADRLGITEVLLRLKDLPLRITGTVTDLREETNGMDITVESPDLTVERLLSLLPAGTMENGADLTASGNASFTMTVSGRSNDTLNPGVHGTFLVSNGTARYGTLPGSITGISLDGAFERPEAGVSEKNTGTLGVRTFSATLGENMLSGKLTVSGFGDPTVVGSLNGNVALGEIRDYYPLGEGTELSGSASCDVSFNGKPMEPKGVRASGSVVFSGVSYSTPGMSRPLRDLNGTARFDNQLIILENMTMTLGGSDLRIDATLRNYPALLADAGSGKSVKPSLDFTLKSKTLNTADLSAGEGGTAGDHAAPTEGTADEGGALLLPGIDMAGTVEVETLRTEKFTFTNTKGAIAVRDGVADLKDMRLEAFGGSVRTSGSLDLSDPSRRPFDLKLDVRDVQSNSLLSPFTTFGKYLFGKLTLSTSMKGDLDDTLGISASTLTGAGTALVSDGKLTGLPLLEKLAGFLSAEKLREVDFKNWSQSFSVADGKLNIKDLKIGGSDASITVNGTHGLDGSIDYSMNVRLPKSVAEKVIPNGVPPALVEFFRDRDSSMSFDFLVGGQSSSPALKLDTRAQEKLLKQRLGEEAAKKLSDPLKKAAEGLKKLIKPDRNP